MGKREIGYRTGSVESAQFYEVLKKDRYWQEMSQSDDKLS